MISRIIISLTITITGCAPLLSQSPSQQFCYHRPSGERRCFSSEQALSADVYHEQVAVLRAAETEARAKALAAVAAHDAEVAARQARSAADHQDLIQDEAFGVLVELRENARERETAIQSAAPSPAPQTPRAP